VECHGAFDYLMTQTQNASYMAKFTPEQLDYFYGFPVWATAAWAIAVWGGVLGVIVLLMRRVLAERILLVSLVALVVSMINTATTGGFAIMGGLGPTLFTALIFVVAVGLWLYARAMKARAVIS